MQLRNHLPQRNHLREQTWQRRSSCLFSNSSVDGSDPQRSHVPQARKNFFGIPLRKARHLKPMSAPLSSSSARTQFMSVTLSCDPCLELFFNTAHNRVTRSSKDPLSSKGLQSWRPFTEVRKPSPGPNPIGHSLSKTTEEGALHQVLSQDRGQGYPDVWVPDVPGTSCPKLYL